MINNYTYDDPRPKPVVIETHPSMFAGIVAVAEIELSLFGIDNMSVFNACEKAVQLAVDLHNASNLEAWEKVQKERNK